MVIFSHKNDAFVYPPVFFNGCKVVFVVIPTVLNGPDVVFVVVPNNNIYSEFRVQEGVDTFSRNKCFVWIILSLATNSKSRDKCWAVTGPIFIA